MGPPRRSPGHLERAGDTPVIQRVEDEVLRPVGAIVPVQPSDHVVEGPIGERLLTREVRVAVREAGLVAHGDRCSPPLLDHPPLHLLDRTCLEATEPGWLELELALEPPAHGV